MTKQDNLPSGYFRDGNGNVRSASKGEFRDGKLFITYDYILESGKTTLRGEHKKLEESPKCVHPERLSCNHGEGFKRCEFMKCVRMGNWVCKATP